MLLRPDPFLGALAPNHLADPAFLISLTVTLPIVALIAYRVHTGKEPTPGGHFLMPWSC